jgi:alkylation response protein AidB-like acyl-CoA dehydrogenase
LDFNLTEQEKAAQKRARHFAAETLAPVAAESDETRHFDRSIIDALGQSGLLGGPITTKNGGGGLSHVAQALVYEELGRVDSSVRGFMAVQTGLVASCLQDWGTEEQKQRYLQGLCDASLIGCYCLTEAEAGSDVVSMSTNAVVDGDGYCLNGEKVWITNGTVADVRLVFAKTDRDAGHRGITAFVIPSDTRGLTARKMTAMELGHRGADHAHVILDNVRVGSDCVLGQVGQGFEVAMSALDHGRLGVAAGAVGIHAAAMQAALNFARTREQFNRPIGKFQMIQKTLTDMHIALEAARALTLKAAWAKDEGKPSTTLVSTAKLYATEAAAKAAHDCVLLHGGRGYNNDFPVERYLRDIVGLEIYEGSSNIQRIIIAKNLLKEEGCR